MLQRPRAVVCDFGDTLLREGPVNVHAGAAAVLASALDAGGCTATKLAEALEALMRDLNPRRQSSQLELPPDTVRRLVHEPLGIRFDGDPADVEWTYWQAATTWSPEPGVVEALAMLASEGVPWAVVSNTMFRGRTIERQLQRSGVPATHAFVMTSTEHIVRKPHPRLFELAAQRLGEEPGALWFIGNSYEIDVCGAAGAGYVPIWYFPKADRTGRAAAHIMRHWAELKDLLHARES